MRFQGKTLEREFQDVSAHVPCPMYLTAVLSHKNQEWDITRREAEHLTSSFVIVVVVFQQSGWHSAPRSTTHDGRWFLEAALVAASQVLHLDHVPRIRARRGAATMPALVWHNGCEVLVWRRGADAGSVAPSAPQGKDLSPPSRARSLAHELEEVDSGSVPWIIDSRSHSS